MSKPERDGAPKMWVSILNLCEDIAGELAIELQL